MLRFWGNRPMDKNPDVVETRERIDLMQEAVQPLLADNKARSSRWEDWKYRLIQATWSESGNKKTYYRLRIVSLTSAITVPSLVGLNLADTGGVVVRWLTFGLSLVAAIATGILTLYRTGDRWLMYRRLREDLMAIGRTLVDSFSADPRSEREAWRAFTSATDKSIAEYNKTYEAAVIHIAQSARQPGPTDQNGRK